MATAAIVTGIGLVAGSLGIVDFLVSNLPTVSVEGASIQVKAGLECPDCTQFGGSISSFRGFDTFNREIGSASGGFVADGGVLDITLDQSTPGQQVDFLSVVSENDATCVSWISVRNFDGVEAAAGAWNGDVGAACGATWYYGNQIAGTFPDGSEWRPACTWLDGDASNGINTATIKFDINAYGNLGAQEAIDAGTACASTIFSGGRDHILEQPNAARKNRRQEETPNADWVGTELVISMDVATHSADFLCNDPSSFGPDFVGNDGLFCDMTNKVLSPVCSIEAVDGCIEIDLAENTIRRRADITKRDTTPVKTYAHIQHWS